MQLEKKIKQYIKDNVLLDELYEAGKFNIEKACEKLGIMLLEVKFENDNISGAIIKNDENSEWKIYVNETDSVRRKRFTVAHELGHYISCVCESFTKKIIHSKGGVLRDTSLMKKEEFLSDEERARAEYEANEIASRLLMRGNLVESQLEMKKNVEEMAEYFAVSESAMTIRLLNLGYTLIEGGNVANSRN